jgi:hypothetical protein
MNSLQQLSEDKEMLKAILSRDEYTAYTKKDHSSFWDLLKPVWRKLRSLFPDFHVPKGTGTLLSYGILIIVLALAALAIYWFSKQIIRQGRIRTASYLPEGEISRSYTYYWQQAAEHGGSGAWREGIRFVFLTLLFYLEAQRLLRVETWKTNWEYASELSGSDPDLVRLFQDCSLLFEQIWYGNEETTETVFSSMHERVALVLQKDRLTLHDANSKEAEKRHAKA